MRISFLPDFELPSPSCCKSNCSNESSFSSRSCTIFSAYNDDVFVRRTPFGATPEGVETTHLLQLLLQLIAGLGMLSSQVIPVDTVRDGSCRRPDEDVFADFVPTNLLNDRHCHSFHRSISTLTILVAKAYTILSGMHFDQQCPSVVEPPWIEVQAKRSVAPSSGPLHLPTVTVVVRTVISSSAAAAAENLKRLRPIPQERLCRRWQSCVGGSYRRIGDGGRDPLTDGVSLCGRRRATPSRNLVSLTSHYAVLALQGSRQFTRECQVFSSDRQKRRQTLLCEEEGE